MQKTIKHCALLVVIFFQSIFCWAVEQERYAIVFDVGNVLLHEPNHFTVFCKAVKKAGGWMRNMFHLNYSLEQKFYDVLNNVGQQFSMPVPVYTKKGPAPHAISVRMAGLINGDEIIDEAGAVIEKWLNEDSCNPDNDKHFSSEQQAELVYSLIKVTMESQSFINFVKPYSEGLKLLQRCASEKYENGVHRHELFIFSNFDTQSWDILLRDHAQFKQGIAAAVPGACEMCSVGDSCGSHRLVSGMFQSEYHVKPNRAFFQVLLHQCALHGIIPEHVIFLDDIEENVIVARSLGITAYHVIDKKSFKTIARDLEQKGILTELSLKN